MSRLASVKQRDITIKRSDSAKGFEVHIPPRLENRGDPYTRVTVEELQSLADLVNSLIHLGRTKQKLKVAKQERDFAEFRDEVAARIRASLAETKRQSAQKQWIEMLVGRAA